MALVELDGLRGDQMHGDGIAGERVEYKHVVILRRLMLHQDAGVSDLDVDRAATVMQVGKTGASQPLDERVDLVERDRIAGLEISGDSSGAEADRTDVTRVALATVAQSDADAGIGRVVGGGLVAHLVVEDLRAVLKGAVVKRALDAGAGNGEDLRNAQRAVEAAQLRDGVVVKRAYIGDQHPRHGASGREPKYTNKRANIPCRDRDKRREHQHAEGEIKVGAIEHGGADANEDGSQGGAEREQQIEAGGFGGGRAQAVELAVAHVAEDEERTRINGQRNEQRLAPLRIHEQIADGGES